MSTCNIKVQDPCSEPETQCRSSMTQAVTSAEVSAQTQMNSSDGNDSTI